MNKVEAFEISQDLTLESAETLLVQCVNYSDYLAEQLKLAQIEAAAKEVSHRDAAAVAAETALGRDAEARKKSAEKECNSVWNEWQLAKIEAGFIRNLLDNNNSKTEVLRTVLSAKKTVFEKTYNNG